MPVILTFAFEQPQYRIGSNKSGRSEYQYYHGLIALENIACINFVGHIIKTRVVAIGDDGAG